MTQTIEKPQSTHTGDPEDVAHMIDCPPDQPSTAEWLATARAGRLVVKAICGNEFIPERDPRTYRVCEACATEAGIRIFGDS